MVICVSVSDTLKNVMCAEGESIFWSVCFVINPILTIIFNANYTGKSAICKLLAWTIHADIIEYTQIF